MNAFLLVAQAVTPSTDKLQKPATQASAAATEQTWQWAQLLDAHFEEGGLIVKFGPGVLIFAAVVGVAIAIWALWLRRKLLPDFEFVEAELQVANLGKVKIRPNRENIQIAHDAWVELSTRKAALPFDEDHDVVAEVYDSYYHLFGHLRDLTKNVPAYRLRSCPDTRRLVEIMVAVLNKGLRPHLTKWQARFRRWYDEVANDKANAGKSPQEIQKLFPQWQPLVQDLKQLQTEVVTYTNFLRVIAQGQ